MIFWEVIIYKDRELGISTVLMEKEASNVVKYWYCGKNNVG